MVKAKKDKAAAKPAKKKVVTKAVNPKLASKPNMPKPATKKAATKSTAKPNAATVPSKQKVVVPKAASAKKKAAGTTLDTATAREKNRLLCIWDDVVSGGLRDKVEQGDVTWIKKLATCFPATTHPVKNTSKAHCVFCHKDFDPKSPKDCRMDHWWELEDNTGYTWEFRCMRCDKQCHHNDDEPPGGYCYKGKCSNKMSERKLRFVEDDDEDDDDYKGDYSSDCSICKPKHAAKDEDEDEEESDEESR
jgi:hypothetical protein